MLISKENLHDLKEKQPLDHYEQTDDDTPSSSDISLPIPPDGGFGWVVCAASFISMIVLDGVLFSFGVFFIELLDYFQDSKGKTALVGSILMGMSMLGGPVVSALVNSYGCRTVTVLGALVAAGAFIVSIFVPSVDILILTYGIIGGFGFCMMFLPSIIVVGLYFERRRALANGIAMCGSGIGTFIFAPLCTYLQNEYTWRGGTLILSGLLLNCCVTGALFRPLEASLKRKRKVVSQEKEMTMGELRKTPIFKGVAAEVVSSNGSAESLDDLYRQRCYSVGHSRVHIHVTPADNDDAASKPDSRLLGDNLKSRSPVFHRLISQSHGQLNEKPNPDKKMLKQLLLKPLYRSDIFYSGSLHNIPEYQSSPNITTFLSKEMVNISLTDANSKETIHCTPECMKENGCADSCGDCVPTEAKSSLKLLYWCSNTIANRLFWLYALSAILWTTHSTILTFIAPYAVHRGIPKEQAALLVASAGVANTIGRIFAGALADRPSINCVLLNGTACLAGGIVVITLPLSESFWLLALEAAAFGLCMAHLHIINDVLVAHWVTLRPIVLVHLLGISNLTNSLGVCAMFQGIAFSLGPPIAGLMFDQTESYLTLFIVAGCMFLTSGTLCMVLYKVSRTRRLIQEEVMDIGVKIESAGSSDSGVELEKCI